MRFDVHALNARQEVVALTLEAASESLAAETARGQGLAVLSVRPRGVGLPAVHRLLSRRASFPTLLFTVELLALLEAGLNLVEALQALSEHSRHGEVVAGMLAAIRRGEPFSHAVAQYPRHFPPLYVATLRAAERTGNVAEALGRYVAYQEELDRVRKKVVSASIYPAILTAVGGLVLAFLLFYVVPRFAQVYEDVAADLPFFSRLLLALGRAVAAHGWTLAAGGLAAAGALAWTVVHPGARARLAALAWRMPALGTRMKIYQLARLYRTAGMLLRAGVPAVRALDMVRDLLPAHLRPGLARAIALIEEGRPMSEAFAAAGLATPIASRMLAVGERSGEMGEMLERVARFHDDENAHFLDGFTRAFEPMLMGALGIAVGLVVVLMYMPIFELAGNLR